MDFNRILMVVLYFTSIHQADQYENLALGKDVTVSQRYNNKDFDPSHAVDGDDSTDLLKCSLTASGQKEAWLTVDLGEEKNIAAISFIHGGFNLALGKHASISSRAHFWSRPELANDGDDGQGDLKCTQTIGNVTEAWWQVDLEGASILSVHITYAENSADTMAGFSVYVSDNSTHFWNGHRCFHHNASSLPALILEFECRVHGRYLTFYNKRRQNVKYPEAYSTYAIVQLCEVEILGCEKDKGGFSCIPCSPRCKDEVCDIETLSCLQCDDGYQGPDCTLECQNSTYGSNCSGRCGHCANDLTCEHVNGTCENGCQTGWLEPFCNSTCPAGYYGTNCDKPCSDKCKSLGQCDSVNGYCVGGCIDGWTGNLCTQQINPSAVAVEDTYTTEVVVGVLVGVLVLVIAIVVIVVFIRYIQRSDSRIIANQKK